MKTTICSSLAACVVVMLLGAGLSGCSNGGGKVDLSNMSKDQQTQAVGQMDAHTVAMEKIMKAKILDLGL